MKNIINCIVVDDEPLAIEQMEDFIGRIDFLKLKASFDNAFAAMNFIKTKSTDIVFLDIEMDDFTGIQLLESLDKIPYVILTTAYDKYAIKGYELDVADYLLKPISYQRFSSAVCKVYDSIYGIKEVCSPSKNEEEKVRDYLFVKTNYKLRKVKFDDVLYIKGMNNYVIIKTKSELIYTLQNMKSIQELLPAGLFIRIHKSFVVSVSKVKSLLKRSARSIKNTPNSFSSDLIIDKEKHIVLKNNEEIVLPRKEFKLLVLLTSSPNKVFTRKEIYDSVWGSDVVVGDRTIDVHIRKLREKIGDSHIKTIKGVGYKFKAL